MFTPFTGVYSGQKSGVNVSITIKINYLFIMFTPFTPDFIISIKIKVRELLCYKNNSIEQRSSLQDICNLGVRGVNI